MRLNLLKLAALCEKLDAFFWGNLALVGFCLFFQVTPESDQVTSHTTLNPGLRPCLTPRKQGLKVIKTTTKKVYLWIYLSIYLYWRGEHYFIKLMQSNALQYCFTP